MSTPLKWKYDDDERGPDSDYGCRCYDCGIEYGEGPFGDLVIPNDLWEMISPTHHTGIGLLCPNCIFNRIRQVDYPGEIIARISVLPMKTPGLKRQLRDLTEKVRTLETVLLHMITEAEATEKEPIELDPKMKIKATGYRLRYNESTEMLEVFGL